MASDCSLTMDRISTLKPKQLKLIAGEHTPPVSLEKCRNLEEMKERLRFTMRSEKGEAISQSKISSMMTCLKLTDSHHRSELCAVLSLVEHTLEELTRNDSLIDKQLQQEDVTKSWRKHCADFRKLLKDASCPIVVAGQVCAGKSTFLNLFLRDESLPTSVLRCTATVCEISYGDTRTLQLVYPDGRIENRDFQDKGQFMNKQENRDEGFDHESVKITLPVPLLKSGITLIDTPGVGESQYITQVLLHYVEKHDVFGFIFVMKCDDAGGVLLRFKEMLRELASIKDGMGKRKLDPTSIIFVANFWDTVPKNQKEETVAAIKQTLLKERCLEGFDPETQIFYMDSQYALESQELGFITEQYEKILNGMQTFFPSGHYQKLRTAYNWLEQLCERVLHPLQVLRYSTKDVDPEILDKLCERLSELEKETRVHMSECLESSLEQREKLSVQLKDFLGSDEVATSLETWPLEAPPPHKDIGNVWWYIHRHLPFECIPRALSSILQSWELEACHFTTAENIVVNQANQNFAPIMDKVVAVERELRSLSVVEQGPQPSLSYVAVDEPTLFQRQFKIPTSESKTPMETRSIHPRLATMQFSMKNQTGVKKPWDKTIRCKCLDRYKKDRDGFLKEKKEKHLQDVRDSPEMLNSIVSSEQEAATEYVKQRQIQLSEIIRSNLELIEKLQHKSEYQFQGFRYQLLEDRMKNVMNTVLKYKNQNLTRFRFGIGSLEMIISSDTKPQLFNKMKHSGGNVTVLRFGSYGPLSFSQYQLWHVEKQLRKISKMSVVFAPFLGRYEVGLSLVFDAELMPAREYWRDAAPESMTSSACKFIANLSQGLQFLHSLHLVHLYLSLSTVAITYDGKPKICCPCESMDAPMSEDIITAMTGDYFYIAPDALPSKREMEICTKPRRSRAAMLIEQLPDRRYTQGCDIYALALMAVELLTPTSPTCSVFDNTKNSVQLSEFLGNPNMPARVHDVAQLCPILNGQLIADCLGERENRPSIDQWMQRWDSIQRELLHGER